jgi:hypothetical protein
MTERRQISATEILDWNRAESPVIRVRIPLDVVPGGLALAMAPMFVRWQSSSPGFGPDDHYIVQNVNIVNNPVGGVVLLATLKVYAASVEKIEFVAVTTKIRKRDTPFGHAMLRFIFHEDRRPVILDQEGFPLANDSRVSDLVLSWEAWRPPEASFDPLKGLDPSTYALTPRCLVGAVRCLNDSILDRPWHCYTVTLPDVEHAHDEMLYSCFALADAVARQTVSHLLGRPIGRGPSPYSDYADALESEWEGVADYHRTANLPEEPIRDVLEGKIRYQALERSCISMALLSLDWGNHRIRRRAGLPEPKRIELAPESLPAFISGLVSGERTPLLLRVPAALHWIMQNQTAAIVGKAPGVLAEAGLLERNRFGRPRRIVYDTRRRTPYGRLSHHIIY